MGPQGPSGAEGLSMAAGWLKRLSIVVLAIAALALPPVLTAQAAEKILRTNIVADPAMIDPITNSELVAGDIMKPMYEGFVAISADGSVTPALATSWTTAP